MKIYSQKSAPALTEQYFQFDPSFGPYILTLREKMETAPETTAKFYRYLIKKFQQSSELLLPFKNVEILKDHWDLIELLGMSLMPLSADSEHYTMALAFMQPSVLFYSTPSFTRTFVDERIEFDTKEDEVSNLRYFVKLVLERCYNVETDDTRPIIKQVRNQEKHTITYYRLNIESRFIHVHSDGEFPPFQENWTKILIAEDEEFWDLFSQFPSYLFRLEGFCMLTVDNVTKEMATNKLKNAILNMHTTDLERTLDKVGVAIGELLNDSRIRIGITPFFKINGRLVYDSSFINRCVGCPPTKSDTKATGIEDVYNKFIANPEPYIFSNIDKEVVQSMPYLVGLLDHDIKSFIVYPIITRDGLMGVFELGFVEEGNVSAKTLVTLQPAFPLITDLIYYMIEIFDNRIDRLVKEKFTPLQQSVEWKFNEVAWQYLLHENEKDGDDSITNVIFKQVHPLYGAVDIRDSSIQRNIALKNDYIHQLTVTIELLTEAAKQVALPLLDSLLFKCQNFVHSITDFLSSEDELKINEFFQHEVVIFLKYLSDRHIIFKSDVTEYLQKMDIEKGEFHYNHRAYETTVKKINSSLVAYFEEESEKLQAIYPFYFERYRTDGVEYNIYIGQAIVPDQLYDPIYLKNLHLWQVTSMAEVAKANAEMQKDLPIPLQTTQIILVHSSPIDISFRKDERRFDVEGSYNIRYEMLKKRIDKVKVKDTMERLTQPGKIAIVYSNSAEVEEYIQHINFLQNKGVLSNSLEMLELENLQGVNGLKALRVSIAGY